jgi:DNA-3-methyladenine glycosylase I
MCASGGSVAAKTTNHPYLCKHVLPAISIHMNPLERCTWPGRHPLMIRYHDEEWGVALHNDQKLFEFLVLDAFQAGLSWQIVLQKREAFRVAFDGFDPEIVAAYDENKINELLQNKDIIRNKLKIQASITNARLFLKIVEEYGSFDRYIWQFTNYRTIHNHWQSTKEIPARSAESDAMSKALTNEGFKFVGSTICYAFMQAAGMVNDHLTTCYRHRELKQASAL